MKQVITILFTLLSMAAVAQEERHVLFIGNSYTSVNNLPQMVADIAECRGDHLTFARNTPGGCTLMQHCSNNSMTLIQQGGWDAVVLQEQSQLPSFPQSDVENQVFPYAEQLVDSIYQNNPCAEPIFYMTWGRRDGDQHNARNYPVLATYEGMDSMLCERYTYMAHTYDASLCPVGRVWHFLRKNNPEIELYASDGSHPSKAGTYAAACAFYVILFQDNPDSITYTADLDIETVTAIRNAVRTIVYDTLPQWKRPQPQAIFTTEIDSLTVSFTSHSLNADSLKWDFGDGTPIVNSNAVSHTYPDSGIYTVSLIASRHCMSDTLTSSITVALPTDSTAIINPTSTQSPVLFPNPFSTTTTFYLPEGWTNATITIYTTDGRKVRQQDVNSSPVSIDLRYLPTGEYLIQATAPGHTITYKIIKK